MADKIPGIFGTSAGLLSDISLSLVVIAAFVSLFGYYFIHFKNNRKIHHYSLITSSALLAAFLLFYIVNSLLYGTNVFKGPANIKLFIYWPLLLIHVTLAIIQSCSYTYLLISGLRRTRQAKAIVFKDSIYRQRHRKLGLISVILMVITASTGIMVYTFLYILYP